MGMIKLQNLIFLVLLLVIVVLVHWTTAGDLLTDNLISVPGQNQKQNSRNFQNFDKTNDGNSVSSRRTFANIRTDSSSENFVTISSPPIMSQKTDQQSGQEMFISQDFSDFSESQFISNITENTDIDIEVNSTYFSEQQPIIQFSLEFQILIYILYNTVFVAAVLGNLLVCYVVFASKRMRTVTNYLIANLAMGDLLMALLCVPFSYIPILFQYWPFGALLCHLVSPAQAVCVFVSAYTLVVLASDRYVAILYPLKPRMRRSQALIVIGLVWLIAIFTAIPIMVTTVHFVDTNSSLPYCEEKWSNDFEKVAYSLSLMVLQYFFPLIVLIFTYTRIALVIWWKKPPGEAEDHRDQRLAKAKRKTVVQSLAVVAGYTLAWAPLNVLLLFFSLFPALAEARYTIFIFFTFHWLAMMIKIMIAIVAIYLISWLPLNLLVVWGDLDHSIWFIVANVKAMKFIFPLVNWIALAHTVFNPIIYFWMNERFRVEFGKTSFGQWLKGQFRVRTNSNESFQLRNIQFQRQSTYRSRLTTRGSSLYHGKLGLSPMTPKTFGLQRKCKFTQIPTNIPTQNQNNNASHKSSLKN